MDEKTASEKVDEEELVIDVDEPQATIEDPVSYTHLTLPTILRV